jgi:hypothetical protein
VGQLTSEAQLSGWWKKVAYSNSATPAVACNGIVFGLLPNYPKSSQNRQIGKPCDPLEEKLKRWDSNYISSEPIWRPRQKCGWLCETA